MTKPDSESVAVKKEVDPLDAAQRQTLALERIRIWQEALYYYDQRRITVLLYAVTINAILVWYSHLASGNKLLVSLLHDRSPMNTDTYVLGMAVFFVTTAVSIFCVFVTYGYTDGCYRINSDILRVQLTSLREEWVSSGRGRHAMHGRPISSYYVIFPVFLSAISGIGLIRFAFLYFCSAP